MINIYDKVYTTLTASSLPVREQGTFAEDETLPETFITYLVLDQSDSTHADNLPSSLTTMVQVAYYSQRPGLVQVADHLIRNLMIPAGFMRAGGRSLPLDKETWHYGYVTTYNYYDSEV